MPQIDYSAHAHADDRGAEAHPRCTLLRHTHTSTANTISSPKLEHDAVSSSSLCEIDLLTVAAMNAHCRENVHKEFVQQVYAMQNNGPTKRVAILQHRMDTDCFDSGIQKEVQNKLYWILLWYQGVCPHYDPRYPYTDCNGQVSALLAEAEAMIERHGRNQRKYLLELAAWKAMCLVSASAGWRSYHLWHDWWRQGWKGYKKQLRDANEIGIIVRLVLPYIG
jgi:hypothetical protein